MQRGEAARQILGEEKGLHESNLTQRSKDRSFSNAPRATQGALYLFDVIYLSSKSKYTIKHPSPKYQKLFWV
jgi:hypothetical protein